MELHWQGNETIIITNRVNEVLLSANRQGLRSLGNILLALAEEEPGSHIHLDEYNSLEEGSVELIIEHLKEKTENG